MKIITPRIHGLLDYAAVALFLNGPTLFVFHGASAKTSYWLCAATLLLAGFTKMPYGAFKMIPFRLHGFIELGVGALLLAAPWLFGFSENVAGRIFFLAMGALTFVIFALTDWLCLLDIVPRDPGDRRGTWKSPRRPPA